MKVIDPAPRTWMDAWLQSRDRPLIFATGVLGYKLPGELSPEEASVFKGVILEQWQVDFLRGLEQGDTRLARSTGHGVGKTFILAVVCTWWLLTRKDSKIAYLAQTQGQLRDTALPEMKKVGQHLPEELRDQLEYQSERVFVKADPTGSFLSYRTCSVDRPDALQGFHAGYETTPEGRIVGKMLIVFDEAGETPTAAFEVGFGAMSTPGAVTICMGNPTNATTYFAKIFTHWRERWNCARVSSEDVPRARGHIDDIIASFGRESNAYRVRVLGQPPTQADNTVIPRLWVEAAVDRGVDPMRVKPVWAIDPARMGDDRSVLVVRQGNVLVGKPIVWRKRDLMYLAQQIRHIFRETETDMQPSEIVIDAIGIGAGLADRLTEMNFCPVNHCNVSEGVPGDDRMSNLRAALWWKARDWFEERDCRIPEGCDDLIDELSSVEYKFTPAGKLQIARKDEIKKETGRSPDLADAFVMTFAADDQARLESDVHRWGSAYEDEPINPMIA